MPYNKEVLKVAHLSDLHIARNFIWQSKKKEQKNCFKNIISLLKNLAPGVIVITGDSVNHPFSWNYYLFNRLIAEMYDELKRVNPTVRILMVPGNHDYSFFGNSFFNLHPGKRFYKKSEDKLASIQGFSNTNEVLLSLFKESCVAFYLLDSNMNSSLFGFARGQIEEIDTTLKDMNDAFHNIAKENGWDYDLCPKMAILHHHPLPVSSLKHESAINSERFLSLKNVYPLLHWVNKFGIKIILHGHKHVSSLSRHVLENGGMIIASSCASSCKVREQKREVRLIEIAKTGACSLNCYVVEGETKVFETTPTKTYPLIDYGETRKNRYLKKSDQKDPVRKVKKKKKIVRISEDGTAIVDLVLEGIEWEEGHIEKFIKERFRADYGRVIGGVYEWQQIRPNHENLIYKDWGRSSSSTFPNPASPEKFEKTFYLPQGGYLPNSAFTCKMQYVSTNCYSVYNHEHEETYANPAIWTNDNEREEASNISVDYPMEYLQMIIQFDNDYFPNNAYLDVSQILPFNQEDDLYYIEKKYSAHRNLNETDFLMRKDALIIHPEKTELELIVKYPQPGLVYTLRWPVPEKKGFSRLSITDNEISENLRREILDEGSTATRQFYTDLVEELKSREWYDDDIKIFLLGYEASDKGLLKVVRHPLNFGPIATLAVGRGAAGKAFKLNYNQCWKKPCVPSKTDYPIEKIIKNLDPHAVAALPISHPKKQNKIICKVFAVLSIVATNNQSKFEKHFHILDRDEMNQEKEQENYEVLGLVRSVNRAKAIKEVYGIIDILIQKHYANILS